MICVYRHIKMCDLIMVIVQLILLCIQHGQYSGLGKQDGALLLLYIAFRRALAEKTIIHDVLLYV